jgi:DNA-binding XRE family transcriptional regulator
LAKRPPEKPRRPTAAKTRAGKPREHAGKKSSNKPFDIRFPERKSVAAGILAANVRRLRKERGLSQQALADATTLDQRAVSLIEVKRGNPTLLVIEQIAEALGTTASELLSVSGG